MSLKNLMELSSKYNEKIGLSEERLRNQLPHLRDMIAFFRVYPDLLVDYMKGPDSTFKFYTYQRVFLRVVMRHRYVFATFPRALITAPIKNIKIFWQTSLIAGTLISYLCEGEEGKYDYGNPQPSLLKEI